MNRKIKQIAFLVLKLLMLIFLLIFVSNTGVGAILGEGAGQIVKVILEFGISIIALFGIGFALYLPTRRHRLLRNTQIQLMKYMSVLCLFQFLALFMTGAVGVLSVSIIQSMPPIILNVMLISFSLVAIMMPFNYVKSLFNEIKGAEYRDPRNLIRQIFQ